MEKQLETRRPEVLVHVGGVLRAEKDESRCGYRAALQVHLILTAVLSDTTVIPL